jgi:hypothetical protein
LTSKETFSFPLGVEDHKEFHSKSESFLNELFGISENPAAPLSADYTGKERAMELNGTVQRDGSGRN